MSEMEERVARAVYEKRNGPGCVPWGHRTKGHRDPYLADARAAIEAMREPTPIMIQDGQVIAPFMVDIVKRSWQAMVDAALAPRAA